MVTYYLAMKKQKNLPVIIVITLLVSCNTIHQKKTEKSVGVMTLDFSQCFIGDKNCNIQINIKRKYKLLYNLDFGLCEYRFNYKDSSALYISTDVYCGSSLNSTNRQSIGIDIYRKNNVLDTIRHEGLQKNGRYWLEYILGDYVVGYVNVPVEQKDEFNQMINSAQKIYY